MTQIQGREIHGRRELNKARTREAIVGALRDLLPGTALTEITVDAVAERAGISRRTFFNYYAGIHAVLVEVHSAYALALIEQIDMDGLRTDPLPAVREMVRRQGVPRDFLAWLALLNCHDLDPEARARIEMPVWTEMGVWLEELLATQLPDGTEQLYIATLATSVMHSFAATEQLWLPSLADPRQVTDADARRFTDMLDKALGYLDRGWAPEHATS
ncbi:TetR/AcrR family transcriptional regulator [Ornithinimicrobium panacihumi]|uniref:TetR/AcrR family transcriptional regulator n=1 Tax=Ornithinimicrobium panacihumi TaxID=2008449 RepID=UPI003F89E43F